MRRISWLVLVSLLCLVNPSLAQPNTQSKAKAMFEQAEAYYKIREFEKALPFYKEAYLLSLEPSMLFNMAQCYRQLGRLQEAIDSYKSFLRDSKANHVLRPKAESLLKEVEAEAALKAKPDSQPTTSPQTQPSTAPDTQPTFEPYVTKIDTTPTSLSVQPEAQPAATSLPITMLDPNSDAPSRTSFFFYGGAATGATALVFGGLALASARAARTLQETSPTNFIETKKLYTEARSRGITADLFALSSGAMLYLGYRNKAQAKE